MIEHKFFKFFSVIITVTCLLSSPLFAMEKTTETLTKAPQAKPRKVTAGERLEFVKGCYDQYPDLNMETPVPELWEFYERDRAFIKSEMPKRNNSEKLLSKLEICDKWVKEKFSGGFLTFFDYSLVVGQCWALALSNKNPLEKITEWDKAQEVLKRKEQGGGDRLTCFTDTILSPTIFVLHVSPTGFVPIPILNDGFGSRTSKGTVGSWMFLGVGTNKSLSFDGVEGMNSILTWEHDLSHARFANYISCQNPQEFKTRIACIANLREKIKEMANEKCRAQAELAFFMAFHETHNFNVLLGEKIKQSREEIKSIYQYQFQESHIKSATSLGLSCEGEKWPAFCAHVEEGDKFLEKQADAYDEKYRSGCGIVE